MYKNRKCKEKYKQILVGIEEKPDSMLAGSSTKITLPLYVCALCVLNSTC